MQERPLEVLWGTLLIRPRARRVKCSNSSFLVAEAQLLGLTKVSVGDANLLLVSFKSR